MKALKICLVLLLVAVPSRAAHHRPAEPEPGSDEDIRARSDTRRLEWAVEVFSSHGAYRSAADRRAAARVMADLATRHPEWSPDLAWLVAEARRATEAEIAYTGEKVLAWHENRPADSRFATLAARSQEAPLAKTESRRRADAAFVGTRDPDPRIRLTSFQWVVDIALSEGPDSDTRILDSLIAGRADPDRRVASFVNSVLAGLAGDRGALWQVRTPAR